MAYLTLDRIVRAAKYIVLVRVIISLSTMFTRISICFLLLRFSSRKKWLEFVIYCIIGAVVVTGLSSVFLVVGQCRPFSKSWDPETPGKCWSVNTQLAFAYYNGSKSASLIRIQRPSKLILRKLFLLFLT